MAIYGSVGSRWSQAGPLGEYIEDHLIGQQPLEMNHCKKLTMKVTTVAVMVIGQIPMGRISVLASNTGMGWAKAVSNVIGFSLLNIWANGKMVKKHMKSHPAVVGVAAVGGILSQIPVIHMAYFYNDKSVVCGALVGVANIPGPIFSLVLMMDSDQKKHMAKAFFIDQLTKNEDKWRALIKQKGHPDAIGALFQPAEEQEEGEYRKVGRYGAEACGALLASANVLFTATLGFNFAQQWADSGIGCMAVSGAVALCTFKLFFHGMMGTTARIYNSACDFFQGRYKAPIAAELKPRLRAALWILGLMLTSLAYDPSIKACQDNYKEPLKSGMTVLVPLGLFVIIANAITDLVDDIVLEGLSQFGNEEQKLIADLHERLQIFKKMVAESTDKEFEQLKNSLHGNLDLVSLQVNGVHAHGQKV